MKDGGQAIRCSNTDDLEAYIKGAEHEIVEELDLEDMMEEYIILHLRLTDGFLAEEFCEKFGVDVKTKYNKQIKKYTGLGLLEEAGGRIRLTSEGIDVSNAVMADFMRD